MDVTPLIPEGKQVIHGYGDGGFTVTGQRYEGSVFILPDKTEVIGATTAEDLMNHLFQEVFVRQGIEAFTQVEIILLGTGEVSIPISKELITAFNEHNVRIEVMDTGAACRTYNVLLSEERRVAAALIAV